MSNRFESRLFGFIDMVVPQRKKPKPHLDKVDQIIDWKPFEAFLKKKLRRHWYAVSNPAFPALACDLLHMIREFHLKCEDVQRSRESWSEKL